MIAFILRILKWIPLNIVSLLGIVQAVIKLFKEIITSIVNIIFPFTPDAGKFEKAILAIRAFIDKFDEWIEKGKVWLLATLGIPIG
jgi:hypothetical protein